MAAFWIGQHAITNATAFEEYLCPMSERHRGRNPRADVVNGKLLQRSDCRFLALHCT
jgi:hypothetical protein